MDDTDARDEPGTNSQDAAEGGSATRFYPLSPDWGANAKLLVILVGFLLAVVGVYLVRNVLAVAALAGLIAFLVAPIIRLGHDRFHIPRGLSLLLAYVVVFVGTVGFGLLVANEIVASIKELDPVGLINDARLWILSEVDENDHLVFFGLTVDMTGVMDALVRSVESGDSAIVVDIDRILDILGSSLSSVRTVAGIVAAVITSAIVTALVAMYLNADSSRFHDGLVEHLPAGYERDGLMLMIKQKRVWRGYLYGQLVNSLITGFFVFVVLWFVGLPGAFLMGAIMVVLNMIPTFGPILAAIPGVLAALISGSTRWPDLENWWFALIVAGIYLLVVQLQANVIAPKVMGTAVQLRPAIVLVGLMVGFQVGGLLGSLLAVPVIASIRDVGVYVWAKLLDKDPFPGEDPIAMPSDT